METYEEYLNGELEKARKDLAEVVNSLGPNYHYATIRTLNHLYESLQMSFQKCDEHYMELEGQKRQNLEQAKRELEEALETHHQSCDAAVARARADAEASLEALGAEKGTMIDRLKSEKSSLESELASVTSQYSDLIALIESDQSKYEEMVSVLHEQSVDQVSELENQCAREIASAYSALQKRINAFVPKSTGGPEDTPGEEEGSEEEAREEGDNIDAEFKDKILAEHSRRTQILSGIEEEERKKLAQCMEQRTSKLIILRRDAKVLLKKAEEYQRTRLESAKQQHASGLEALSRQLESETKEIDKYESAQVEERSQSMKDQCRQLELEHDEKKHLLESIQDETEQHKGRFMQLIAELSTDVPRDATPEDTRHRFVYCHVRPMNQIDVEQGDYEECVVSHFPQDVGLMINPHFAPEHYEFDGVFLQQSTLKQIFETVKPHLLSLFNIPCLSLLSSGPQFSGKSYLMEGRNQDGLLYLTLKALFKVPKKIKTCNFTFSVSIMEIYRNNVFDLLACATSENNNVISYLTRMDVERNDKGFAVIKGLKETEISSFDDFLETLETAFHRREEATEGMKYHASSSHLIVHVIATKIDRKSGTVSHHSLNFIELASTDRVAMESMDKKSQEECNWIQHSLNTLLQAIVEKGSFEKDCLSFFLKEDIMKPKSTILFYQNISPVHSAVKASRHALAFCSKMRIKDNSFAARVIAATQP